MKDKSFSRFYKSIRWQITIPFVTLLLITMIGFSLYLSFFVRDLQIENLHDSLTHQAELLADMLLERGFSDETSEALNTFTLEWSQKLDARITIIAPDGTVLADSHENWQGMENHFYRAEVQQAKIIGTGFSIRKSSTIGYEMLYTCVPIFKDGEIIGYSRVSLSLEEVDRTVSTLNQNIRLGILIATLIMIFIASLIAVYYTTPLMELTESATRLAEGNYNQSLSISTKTSWEITQLAAVLDRMASQQNQKIIQLETEQGKLSAVLRQMTDGVIIANEEGQVILINPAASTMLNIKQKDALKFSVVHVIRNHEVIQKLEKCKQTKEEQTVTIEVQGNTFLKSIVTSLDGTLDDHYLIVFQDLTDIRKLETIRRDFVSNISHELRTPLASLKALSETLSDSALDDPPSARHFLKRMEIEVDALTQMVHELLELSRIESGKVPLNLSPSSPCAILQNAFDRLVVQAERADISMNVTCEENLPAILADAPRLEQVIVNLIHNAIKFTPPSGEVYLNCYQKKKWVYFTVQDTGIGIHSDDLSRVFERFYKTDRARSSGGTGLGLSIAKHTVEAHGGNIWVESELNRGSIFFFRIPAISS